MILKRHYKIASPIATHTRKATCQEVDCTDWRDGWTTRIDEATELGKKQAAYIRANRRKEYTETTEAGLTVFKFKAGARCFKSYDHMIALEREAFYIVKDDGHPPIQHDNGLNWVEDFADHQNKLSKAAR